jgi:hypothetical protein
LDDKQGILILAVLGILKLTLEILKLLLELLEKVKAHPKRQPRKQRRRK